MKQRSTSPHKKTLTYSLGYIEHKLDTSEDRKTEAAKWLPIIQTQRETEDKELILIKLHNELGIKFKKAFEKNYENAKRRKQKAREEQN